MSCSVVGLVPELLGMSGDGIMNEKWSLIDKEIYFKPKDLSRDRLLLILMINYRVSTITHQKILVFLLVE